MGGFEVIGFKIRVIFEDFRFGGLSTEEFEQEFDGVAEATNAGFPMANLRGNCDAFEELLCRHGVRISGFGISPRWNA
jgi:hypothetical protein